MNYWPLTRALGTNRHGDRPDDTDLSRVSFDFRVLALRDFRKLAKDGTFTS